MSVVLTEELEPGIVLVTMNRPDSLNAAGGPMHPELERVWLDINEDERVKAVVLTGAGRAFSAGGDLAMAQRMAGGGTLIEAVSPLACRFPS